MHGQNLPNENNSGTLRAILHFLSLFQLQLQLLNMTSSTGSHIPAHHVPLRLQSCSQPELHSQAHLLASRDLTPQPIFIFISFIAVLRFYLAVLLNKILPAAGFQMSSSLLQTSADGGCCLGIHHNQLTIICLLW